MKERENQEIAVTSSNLTKERTQIGLEDLPNIYFGHTRLARAPMITIQLRHTVSVEALEYGVTMAMKRYLLLNLKVIKGEDDYQFAWNDQNVLVKHMAFGDNKIHGTNTNEFPWLVSYHENYFVFSFSHGLFDGVGAFEVVKTILYYYAQKQGINIQDSGTIKTLHDNLEQSFAEEMKLSLESYWDKTVTPFPEKPLQTPNYMALEHLIEQEESSTCHRITIDVDTLIPAIKRYETTPFAILVPIFARSVQHLYDCEKPVIQTQTVVNCRPVVQSHTLRNCIELAGIDYISEKMDDMSIASVATIFRSILDVKMNPDNLVATMTKHYEGLSSLWELSLDARIDLLGQSVSSRMDSAFIFSYTGRIQLPPELEELVSNFEVAVETSISPFLVEAIGYQNKLTLVVTNRLKDTSYLDYVVTALGELSIDCTLEHIGHLPDCIYTPMS